MQRRNFMKLTALSSAIAAMAALPGMTAAVA